MVSEGKGKIAIQPIKFDEKHMLMLLSEISLKKEWQNPYDERWDDVLYREDAKKYKQFV